MKQFIYASAGTYAAASFSDATDNQVGILQVGENGVYNVVLKRKELGNYVVPIASKGITYTVGNTSGTNVKFTETFTIADVKPGRIYTLVFIKKGKKFNERSNWTATFRAGISDTPTTIAAKIAEFVNVNKLNLGLDAVPTEGAIKFTAVVAGEDFEILGADELFGIKGSALTPASVVILGQKDILKLALECAADKGFEYTEEDIYELYPEMKEDFADAANNFTVVTIHSTEDRKVGTRTDSVNTIVHIVVPNGAVTNLTTELDKLK